MFVFDEITGKRIPIENSKKVIIGIKNGIYIYGYVDKKAKIISVRALRPYEVDIEILDTEENKKFVKYSQKRGIYFYTQGIDDRELVRELYGVELNKFPYSFTRRYEAVESFNLFHNKQKTEKTISHDISKFLDYTFGVEFETSYGYISEDDCYKSGLIPLRDGSITGLEYSTVILKGETGFNLLDQQLDLLKRNTWFDKECSLHFHFGGYPLDSDKLFSLYNACLLLQREISMLVPKYTFQSSKYKASGKDYCKYLPQFSDFNSLYYGLVGDTYYGDLTQPHPHDIRREAKWRIHTRYYWVNFINAFCYKVNKTIEFRLLRPTYNKEKIYLWLYIFNAILKYSEKNEVTISSSINLSLIIKSVYPEEISEKVLFGIEKLKVLKENQEIFQDYIGSRLDLENKIFDENGY